MESINQASFVYHLQVVWWLFCCITTFLTQDARNLFQVDTRSAIKILVSLKSKFWAVTNDVQLIHTISESTSKSTFSLFFSFSFSFSTTRRMQEACSDLIQPARLFQVFIGHGLLFYTKESVSIFFHSSFYLAGPILPSVISIVVCCLYFQSFLK